MLTKSFMLMYFKCVKMQLRRRPFIIFLFPCKHVRWKLPELLDRKKQEKLILIVDNGNVIVLIAFLTCSFLFLCLLFKFIFHSVFLNDWLFILGKNRTFKHKKNSVMRKKSHLFMFVLCSIIFHGKLFSDWKL